MRVVCVGTDRDINYFLHSFNIECEQWNTEDAKFNFRLALKQDNIKQIIVVDEDRNHWIRDINIPNNWYVIALTSDCMLKNDKFTIINKGSSNENILNVIQDLTDETVYTQLGMFPLYLGVTRHELMSAKGRIGLVSREWRLLNYLNLNKGRRVYTEELIYHFFNVGEADDFPDGGVALMKVYISKLRKRLSLVVNSPVISYGHQNAGYYLLDFYNEEWEYLINNERNYATVIIDDKFKTELKNIYEVLAKEVAEKSVYEIRNNYRLTSRSRRYSFLKNNLTFREFSIARLITLLKKIRFSKHKIRLKPACTESFEELEYKK